MTDEKRREKPLRKEIFILYI